MATLTTDDILKISYLVVFVVLSLSILGMFLWCGRREGNKHIDAVVPVEPGEPHSITITFVPAYPIDGIRAPQATPAANILTSVRLPPNHPTHEESRRTNAPAA